MQIHMQLHICMSRCISFTYTCTYIQTLYKQIHTFLCLYFPYLRTSPLQEPGNPGSGVNGVSNSVQVLFHGTEAVVVLTSISLK